MFKLDQGRLIVRPQVLASIFALAFHKLEHHSFMHEL
jgi:hypothetical protein